MRGDLLTVNDVGTEEIRVTGIHLGGVGAVRVDVLVDVPASVLIKHGKHHAHLLVRTHLRAEAQSEKYQEIHVLHSEFIHSARLNQREWMNFISYSIL